MSAPCHRYAVIVLLLLVVACDDRNDSPSQPPPAKANELSQPDNTQLPDLVGMEFEEARQAISVVAGVSGPPQHLITYRDDGHDIIAMMVQSPRTYDVVVFMDGKLLNFLTPPIEVLWGPSYQALIQSLAEASPISDFREYCLRQLARKHESERYREKQLDPLPAWVVAAAPKDALMLDDERILAQYDALKISLGDDRVRVVELFGPPARSVAEGDEIVLVYEADSSRFGKLVVSVWLKEDQVVRARTRFTRE